MRQLRGWICRDSARDGRSVRGICRCIDYARQDKNFANNYVSTIGLISSKNRDAIPK